MAAAATDAAPMPAPAIPKPPLRGGALALLTLAISFNPQPLLAYAQAAARTLGAP